MTPATPRQPLALSFPGRPRAVQSVRFARIGPFLRKYQPQEVVEWKNLIALQAQTQLPPGFSAFDGVPLRLIVEYRFAPPKSMPKRDLRALQAGAAFYKTTKPDLSDNLNKGLLDALTGLVWKDDALIAQVHARKLYTAGPERTDLRVEPLAQGQPGAKTGSTSQRGALQPAAGEVGAPEKADCGPGEAPRSAFSPRNGELPLFDPPPAKNAKFAEAGEVAHA